MRIEEFIRKHQKTNPHFTDFVTNDRLFVHDLLHAILNASFRSLVGEETTSIYQAVLLRDDRVKVTSQQHMDHGQNITLECIQEKVLPGVRDFLRHLGERHGFVPTLSLEQEEVVRHFEAAERLHHAFIRVFGRSFGDIPVKELKEIPTEIYLGLVAETKGPSLRSTSHGAQMAAGARL
jgi:hypothetical protein